MFTLLIFGLLLPFAFGSIPFGLLITWSAGLGDIRAIGSGNVGATNVLRTGKKGLALATLLCDAGKGALAVFMAQSLGGQNSLLPLIAGVVAILGHIFSPWLRFKGGKGVATSIGVILALSWPVGLCAILVWIFMAWKFRYSSLAALTAAASTPIFALLFADWKLAIAYLCIAALIASRHQENIARLRAGTESTINFGSKA
jgi:glycerol-3-phosphate acyltransferase PlsY